MSRKIIVITGTGAVLGALAVYAADAWVPGRRQLSPEHPSSLEAAREIQPVQQAAAEPAPARQLWRTREEQHGTPHAARGFAAPTSDHWQADLPSAKQTSSSQQHQPPAAASHQGLSVQELASTYAAEVQALRQMLQERGVELHWKRFHDNGAELVRYAISCGLLKAQTSEARQHVLQSTADALADTASWLSMHSFLDVDGMAGMSRLIRWHGRDQDHRPVMLIRMAEAVRHAKAKAAADYLAEVIISQTEYAVQHLLGSGPGQAEQMVVIMDCRETSALQASRLVRTMRTVGLTLNRHYPGRLFAMLFVEPPSVMKWPIQAIKPLLHPNTGNKLHVCRLGDPAIPVEL